jgi:hypothetical protein
MECNETRLSITRLAFCLEGVSLWSLVDILEWLFWLPRGPYSALHAHLNILFFPTTIELSYWGILCDNIKAGFDRIRLDNPIGCQLGFHSWWDKRNFCHSVRRGGSSHLPPHGAAWSGLNSTHFMRSDANQNLWSDSQLQRQDGMKYFVRSKFRAAV